MPRHAKTHTLDAEYVVTVFCVGSFYSLLDMFFFARKLPCPWEGCPFSTLQKSNLATHINGQYMFFLFHHYNLIN